MPQLIYRIDPEELIYDEGREAFIMGIPIYRNPYDPRTPSALFWRRGFLAERSDAHDLIKEAGRKIG